MVAGLPKISGDLVGKAWQDEAVKDVSEFIVLLMGRALPIVFVKNSTARRQDAEVTYSVQMASVENSRAIRRKFGSYFLTGVDKRPTPLKPFSVKNFVTPATRIRISVMKLIGKRYRESNPGSKVKVIGYQPRPMIKIVPSSSSSDRRVMFFNYVEAVRKLPCSFASADIDPIVRRISQDLLGQIRSIFVVITDDMYRQVVRNRAPGAGNAEHAGSGDEAASVASEASAMSEVSEVRSEVRSTRPSGSSGSRSGRGSKRGASPSLASSQSAKK